MLLHRWRRESKSRSAREKRSDVGSEEWAFPSCGENSKVAVRCVSAEWSRLTPRMDCVALRLHASWRYFVRAIRACLLLSCFPVYVAAQNSPATPAGEVVHYKGALDNVKYVFGVAPPVARLRPGNILDANSLDCFGNGIQRPGDTTAMAKGDNPLTGPFYIEGAEPGDTLVVRILDLTVDGNQGVGAFSPGFGAINSTH